MFKYWHFICLSIGLYMSKYQAFSLKSVTNIFSDFSTKTYAVGTQNSRLIDMVLLSTKTHVKSDG